MTEVLDGGVLRLRSELVITDWADYTYGCSVSGGEVAGARVELPHGAYRVTIHRAYGEDDEPDELYMIELQSTLDAPSEPADIPGNDGFF